MLTSVHRIMDESPRWLMMEGRHEEAIKILKKMAKMNGRSLPEDRYLKVLTDKIDEEVSQIHMIIIIKHYYYYYYYYYYVLPLHSQVEKGSQSREKREERASECCENS